MNPDPTDVMKRGAEELEPVLEPLGFSFRIVREGDSSGGGFCEAEFVRGRPFREGRRIELHFRGGLGMVRYHVGKISASHTEYVRALQAEEASQYPGFGGDEIEGFRRLARDLALIRADFIEGDCRALKQAATAEASLTAAAARQDMIGYVGDRAARAEARRAFREKKYAEVVRLLEGLQYAEDLSPAEKKMLALARRRTDAE